MNKKILVIGGATRDIFIQPTQSPDIQFLSDSITESILKSGTKIDVEDIMFHTGGGATNTAVSFARLGFDVSVVCKVADDEAGAAVLADLKKNNVNTNLLISALAEAKTKVYSGTSFILQVPSGDDPILAYRGINTQLTFADVQPHISEAQNLYITSLSGAASHVLLPLVQEAKKHNIFVATNPGSSQLAAGAAVLQKALPYLDVLILNMHEAHIFLSSFAATQKKFELKNFFRKMLDVGVRTVVVTDGARGVHVATQEFVYFCPAVPAKVVSSVGAGDAFGSCFVASLLQEKNIEHALVRGMLNSASVLEHVGAKVGLLFEQELLKKVEAINVVQVQKSKWPE